MVLLRHKRVFLAVLAGTALLLTGCGGLFRSGIEDSPEAGYGFTPSPNGEYLVVFERKTIPDRARQELAALDAEIKKAWPQIGGLLVRSGDPDFPQQAMRVVGVKSVGHHPMLTLPVEDRKAFPGGSATLNSRGQLSPALDGSITGIADNDFYVNYQWDIRRVGGDADTWAIEKGAGVTVAVLDTGVYSTHPDIALNYAYGKDFTDITVALPPGWIMWDAGGPVDYEGHGTHVAGSIAASITAGRVIGVAPEAQIANYKVMIAVITDEMVATGIGFQSWIIDGIIAAADDGVNVINMSLGGTRYVDEPDGLAAYITYARAVQYAWDKGVLVVSAAGNDAIDLSRGPNRNVPGGLPASLSISATGPNDTLAFYSNYGAHNADFTGPGGDVSEPPFSYCLSAYSPLNAWAPGAGWVFSVGTSMAAPKVAGVAALIIAANPGISPTGVVRVLERTAEDLGPEGYDFQFGWGLAHAYRALIR